MRSFVASTTARSSNATSVIYPSTIASFETRRSSAQDVEHCQRPFGVLFDAKLRRVVRFVYISLRASDDVVELEHVKASRLTHCNTAALQNQVQLFSCIIFFV